MSYQSVVQATAPTGLHRYYRFEGATAAVQDDDYSGNNVACTFPGGLVVSSGAGFVGQGIETGLSSGYCTFAFVKTGATGFCLATWFKALSSNAVIWRDGSTSGGWLMLITGADVTLRINGTDRTITGLGTTLGNGSYHFVAVRSTGTSVETYLGDTSGTLTLVDTWAFSANASTLSGSQMYLGRNGGNAVTYHSAYDEPALWLTTIPSGAQIAAIYAQAVGPGVPTSVSSPAQTSTTLQLAWSAPTTGGAVTGYEVRLNGGAPSAQASPYTFTGLTAGTSYTLEVRAVGPAGNSSWVTVVVSTTVAAPGVPTAVTAGTVTFTTAGLSWGAPATGGPVDHYDARADGGAGSAATSPHTFTGLGSGATHTLEVRAVNSGGSSGWVSVSVDTPELPAGYYRGDVQVGPYTWSVEHGTEPDYGPRLPIRWGWSMPDQVEFFPCQPDQTTATLQLYVANAHDIKDVVKGSTVTMAIYLGDPAVDPPWQSFSGIVTQLDGQAVPGGGFLATVYATDDTARLGDMVVGYTGDWPQESIYDRVQRICDEAGISFATGALGVGLGGTLAPRASSPIDALSALRASLKDAADEDDSTNPLQSYYGRHVISYTRDDDGTPWDSTAAADTTMTLYSILRRVPGEWQDPPDPQQLELDGSYVDATGAWSKLAGPDGRTWALVDGTTFGTPSGPPIVRNTSLVDIIPGDNSGTAATRDNLGESLVPDGSTQLSGWYARALRYEAWKGDPDPVGAYLGLDAPGLASWAPITFVMPVVVVDVLEKYDLEDVGYLAGTLTGAWVTLAPGGRYYVDLRLRPELLPGMELP